MPPDPSAVTPRDIFLAAHLSAEAAAGFLEQRGLRDGGAADEHLQQLADDLSSRLALGNLANLLFDTLATTPDPDAAVVGFCRYVATRTPQAAFIGNLQADPRMLEILTQILGTSPFLSEILIRNPEYLHWLRRELDSPPPDRAAYEEEIDRRLDATQSVENQVNALKRFQRREVLRVAARDLFGMLNRETLTTTTTQLSNLADALVDGVLRLASAEHAARHGPLPGRFAVIGMGKLGGVDLNYSSDIDLIYIYEVPAEAAGDAHHRYQRLGRRLTTLLSEHTAEGYLYRVDMRLRPMGARGNLVYSLQQSAQYYENLGETFERFALLKARPIAGDRALGEQFVSSSRRSSTASISTTPPSRSLRATRRAPIGSMPGTATWTATSRKAAAASAKSSCSRRCSCCSTAATSRRCVPGTRLPHWSSWDRTASSSRTCSRTWRRRTSFSATSSTACRWRRASRRTASPAPSEDCARWRGVSVSTSSPRWRAC